MWHPKIPKFPLQGKSPGSMLLIFAPSFKSSSLTCKCQYLLALGTLGGHKYTILFFFLARMLVLLSIKLTYQFSELISVYIDLTPICEQHHESLGKSWSSSNPLAHNLALVIQLPSTTFLFVTHFTDMQGCPESSSSK